MSVFHCISLFICSCTYKNGVFMQINVNILNDKITQHIIENMTLNAILPYAVPTFLTPNLSMEIMDTSFFIAVKSGP